MNEIAIAVAMLVVVAAFMVLLGYKEYLDHKFRSEHPEEWMRDRERMWSDKEG